MNDNFFDSNEFSEIKIFEIDTLFWELKDISSSNEIINFIIDKHRRLVGDNELIGNLITPIEQDNVSYYSYVYNDIARDSYWKSYLPSSISSELDFEIKKISFTLFAEVGNRIFAIVGGGGIRVIKRYINDRFGLEFYEYLTIPQDDIISSLTVRGISGRLIEKKDIFRNGQTLLDSIGFTEIPMNINLTLREDLKNSLFAFINFTTKDVTIEVASYFYIKHKLQFIELHQLFLIIENTMSEFSPIPLSSFVKEKDTKKMGTYKLLLCIKLREDMYNRFFEGRSESPVKFDIDFKHPSLTQSFYECNKYELVAKNKRNPFFTTSNREELYEAALKYTFEQLPSEHTQEDFNYFIFGIRVYGFSDTVQKTVAMYLNHITCEIKNGTTPIFLIDNNWFNVKNDFEETATERCFNTINKSLLKSGIMNTAWDDRFCDEDAYNKAYSINDNCYVFDKMLGQNIEFCDIMIEEDNAIYLVHVKNGFDAKIRDLSNQILVSATRFWNDINSDSSEFLNDVINSFNRSNPSSQIDKAEFLLKFKSKKDIIFVMAYNSNKSQLSLMDRITNSKSNIAKYSLIQCSQEMTALYPLRIIDIADIIE